MCELFGVTSNKKVKLNNYLKEFFSHSNKHPNGWGMAFFDDADLSIIREPKNASKSSYLDNLLSDEIESSKMLAHIHILL